MHFCVVVCLKWHKAAIFLSKDVNLTGLLAGHKRRLGARGWKSISGVQGRSPGRESWDEAEAFFVKLHIIFALKYNKQQ